MKVELSSQVVAFGRTLAPDPRRVYKAGLRRLESEQGDIQPLEGELIGFYRLRIGRFRVMFHYVLRGGHRVLRCEYAEERSIVYQLANRILRRLSPGEMSE